MIDLLGNTMLKGDTVIVGASGDLCPGIVVKDSGGGRMLVKRMSGADSTYVKLVDDNPHYYNYLSNAATYNTVNAIKMPITLMPDHMREPFEKMLHLLRARNYLK